MKIVFVVLAILLAWWILRLLRRSATTRPSTPHKVENMVACHHCGLHIPEDEAIVKEGHRYCCEAHARLEQH